MAMWTATFRNTFEFQMKPESLTGQNISHIAAKHAQLTDTK